MLNLNLMEMRPVSVSQLIPHPKNPRVSLTPDMPMYVKLRESLLHNDYVEPIVWNERTGYVLSGHQRIQVIKDIMEEDGEELDTLDVVVVDIPPEKELTVLTSLNKITGIWDADMLKQILLELPEDERMYTGFEEFEIQSILDDAPDLEVNEEEFNPEGLNYKQRFQIIVDCKSEDDMQELYDRFKEEGLKCRLSTS